MLKKHMGAAAPRVPTREMPDWIVRLLAHFISDMKMIAPEVGKQKNISNEKARRVLGWTPRSNEESTVATAESLQRLGLLKR
jgi:dihydroflavonol-4-reductase